MNCDMLYAARRPLYAATTARQRAAGNGRFSLLQIDVEVEESETSENQTQSFVIHNNHDMEEKGIVFRDCLPLEPRFPMPAAEGPSPRRCPLQEAVVPKRCPLPRRWSLDSEALVGDNQGEQPRATIPFSSMSWFSLLQIDVDVEESDTSENPMQSFEIHDIVWRRTQLLAVIIYII